MEYYHADRLQYAVVGTPNRLEYDQGFFVKNGDGAADLKPIAHLYKLGLSASCRAQCSRRDSAATANDGYLLIGAIAGGVLFLPPSRQV